MRSPITIIVPAYNAQATLRECLAALNAARQPQDEIVLFDDGSTDETNAIATAAGARILRNPGKPQGPAHGRNEAARQAMHDRLIFVDADVILERHCIDRLAAAMDESGASAAFGSYDDRPRSQRATSLYANLRHHHVHQHGQRDATTFWSGIGMIEKRVFLAAGGYDKAMFRFPSVEDVELGMRINAQGHRIILVPDAQGTHWKDWSLWRVWHTDIVRRALPWSCLIADGEVARPDLNLARAERLSALFALSGLGLLLISPFWHPALLLALIAVALYIFNNRKFFGLLGRRLTPAQLVVACAMHYCYHIYASVTLVGVIVATKLGLRRARPRIAQVADA